MGPRQLILQREDTPGEWLDRYIIWGLKSKNIPDPRKARQADAKMQEMQSEVDSLELASPDTARFHDLMRALWSANSRLWTIEDKIRALDADVFPLDPEDEIGEKRAEYMSLARSVYRTNDERSRIKAHLDELFGYNAEVKEYHPYKENDDE